MSREHLTRLQNQHSSSKARDHSYKVPFKLSNVILRHSSFTHTSTFSEFEVSYKNALYKLNSLLLLLLLLLLRKMVYQA